MHNSNLIRLKPEDIFPHENKDKLTTFYLFKKDSTYALKTSEAEKCSIFQDKVWSPDSSAILFRLFLKLPNGQKIQQRFAGQISTEGLYQSYDRLWEYYE